MCRRSARSLRAPARLPRCQPHMRAAEMAIGVKDKDDDLKAYFAEAESWDRDRFVAAVRSRRIAWIVAATAIVRSEERRVGEEGVSTCRSRWWQSQSKKKKNTT